jgi:hypothetical protein
LEVSGIGFNPSTNHSVSNYKPNTQRKPIILSTDPITIVSIRHTDR